MNVLILRCNVEVITMGEELKKSTVNNQIFSQLVKMTSCNSKILASF